MIWIKISLICLLAITTIFGQKIRILLVMEEPQMNLESMFAQTFSDLEKTFSKNITVEKLKFMRAESEAISTQMCNILSTNDFSAIVDMTWGGWILGRETVFQKGLPYLRLDVTVSPYIQALEGYFKTKKERSSVFVFETKEKMDQSLYYAILHSHLRIVGAWKESPQSMNNLQTMKPRPSNIAIFGTSPNVNDIWRELESRELLRRDSQISLIYTDFTDMSFIRNISDKLQIDSLNAVTFTMANVTCCIVSSKCNCSDLQNPMFLFLSKAGEILVRAIDLSDKTTSAVSKKWECSQSYANSTREILYQNILDVAKGSMVLYNKDTYDIPTLSINLDMEVHAVKHINMGMSLVGEYMAQTAKFQENPNSPSKDVKNFYRVGIVLSKPWAWVGNAALDRQTDPNSLDKADKLKGLVGYSIDMLTKLALDMNFEYEVVIASDNDYGRRKAGTNEWTGIMKDLIQGTIDISLASMIMTTEREEFIDFVTPYFDQSGISILSRKKYEQRNYFKVLTVLKPEVWYVILGCIGGVTILLWILDKLSPYSYINNREAYPEGGREFTFGESLWFCLTSLTPQGGGDCPKALSGRLLVGCYWLFIVLMLATFTSNLAALFTVERMQEKIKSLQELATQTKVNYTVVAGSPTWEYFSNMAGAEEALFDKWKEMTLNSSSDETKYRVWDYPIREQFIHMKEMIKQAGPVNTAQEGFSRVKDDLEGTFALIHDAMEVTYQYYTNCEFTKIGETFAEQPLAVAVPEGSQLAAPLSQQILVMQSERFFEQISSKYWNISNRDDCPVTDDTEGITLTSLAGIFIAALGGLILAIVILFYEVYTEKTEVSLNKIGPHTMRRGLDERGKKIVLVGNKEIVVKSAPLAPVY